MFITVSSVAIFLYVLRISLLQYTEHRLHEVELIIRNFEYQS